jgi:hypothetical protein
MINDEIGVITESGPNYERNTEVGRSVCDNMSCYWEVFRRKKLWTRQAVFDSFLKERTDIYAEN